MKNIYLLYSCDVWKSNSSMRLVMASTSLKKVKSAIVRKINDGSMSYQRGEQLSKIAQIKRLREDIKEQGIDFAFDALEYGYIDIVEDGEIQ